MYDFFLTNTTVEPFNWTTTRGSGLMKELKINGMEDQTMRLFKTVTKLLILLIDGLVKSQNVF